MEQSVRAHRENMRHADIHMFSGYTLSRFDDNFIKSFNSNIYAEIVLEQIANVVVFFQILSTFSCQCCSKEDRPIKQKLDKW